jgi:hypothetical protein
MTAQPQIPADESAPVEAWESAKRAHCYLATGRHRSSKLESRERSVIVREIRRHAAWPDRSGPTRF